MIRHIWEKIIKRISMIKYIYKMYEKNVQSSNAINFIFSTLCAFRCSPLYYFVSIVLSVYTSWSWMIYNHCRGIENEIKSENVILISREIYKNNNLVK